MSFIIFVMFSTDIRMMRCEQRSIMSEYHVAIA